MWSIWREKENKKSLERTFSLLFRKFLSVRRFTWHFRHLYVFNPRHRTLYLVAWSCCSHVHKLLPVKSRTSVRRKSFSLIVRFETQNIVYRTSLYRRSDWRINNFFSFRLTYEMVEAARKKNVIRFLPALNHRSGTTSCVANAVWHVMGICWASKDKQCVSSERTHVCTHFIYVVYFCLEFIFHRWKIEWVWSRNESISVEVYDWPGENLDLHFMFARTH